MKNQVIHVIRIVIVALILITVAYGINLLQNQYYDSKLKEQEVSLCVETLGNTQCEYMSQAKCLEVTTKLCQ